MRAEHRRAAAESASSASGTVDDQHMFPDRHGDGADERPTPHTVAHYVGSDTDAVVGIQGDASQGR